MTTIFQDDFTVGTSALIGSTPNGVAFGGQVWSGNAANRSANGISYSGGGNALYGKTHGATGATTWTGVTEYKATFLFNNTLTFPIGAPNAPLGSVGMGGSSPDDNYFSIYYVTDGAGAMKMRLSQGSYNAAVVSTTLQGTYTGPGDFTAVLVVQNGAQSLTMFGVTVNLTCAFITPSEFNSFVFNGFDSSQRLKSVKIETVTPPPPASAFWTGLVNTHENI